MKLDPRLMLRTLAARPVAVAAALLGNLVPVYGVVALGWNASQILLLYWVENVILGVLTLARIRKVAEGKAGGCFLGGFFVIHYGAFCLAHLVFALYLIREIDPAFPGLGATLGEPPVFWAVMAIFGLNLFTQWREWWRPGLWRDGDIRFEMVKPYGRIVVMHLTVLLGAWLMALTRAPVGAILLLCLLKAALEILLLSLRDTIKPEAA